MFLKDPAEISLVVIAAHFTDLFYRKGRLMDQQLLCMAHPEIDQIFGRGAVIDLTEDFGQVAGTVVHGSCNQVQVDILCIIPVSYTHLAARLLRSSGAAARS